MNHKSKTPATRVNVEPATTTKSRRRDKDAAEALLDLFTKALEEKEKMAIEGLTSLRNAVIKTNRDDVHTSACNSFDVVPEANTEQCSHTSEKGQQNRAKDVSVQVLVLYKPVQRKCFILLFFKVKLVLFSRLT